MAPIELDGLYSKPTYSKLTYFIRALFGKSFVNGVDRKNQTGYHPPQIDPIGYLIGDVSRMIRTVYDRRVEPLGLTRAQWRVMTRLNRMKGCTQTELAIALEIEKPTLGKLIERLEAKGWVKRQPDLDDARSKIVCLTPAARPVLEEMQSEAEKVVMAIFAGVSQDDAKRLHRTLNNIKSNLSVMLEQKRSVEE